MPNKVGKFDLRMERLIVCYCFIVQRTKIIKHANVRDDNDQN